MTDGVLTIVFLIIEIGVVVGLLVLVWKVVLKMVRGFGRAWHDK